MHALGGRSARRNIQVFALLAYCVTATALAAELGLGGLAAGVLLGVLGLSSLKLALVGFVGFRHGNSQTKIQEERVALVELEARRLNSKMTMAVGELCDRVERVERELALAIRNNDAKNQGTTMEVRNLIDRVEHAERELAVAVQDVEAKTQIFGEELDHYRGLSHRIEPTVAGFAALRHEVLYLREALARLRAQPEQQ